MTNRVVAGWGLADGVGCTFGGDTSRWAGAKPGRFGAWSAPRPQRYRGSWDDLSRGEAAPEPGTASGDRRTGPGSRSSPTDLLVVRRPLSREGLAAPSSGDSVWYQLGAPPTVSLC